MRKRVCRICLAWFLILGCLAGCGRQDYSSFIEVGGYEISKEEYAMLAYDNISLTAREYAMNEMVDVNAPDFWEKQFGGTTPIERVKDLTDENAIRQKGVQVLAKENGLIEDISYEGFLKQYQEENNQRKKLKEAGEVVYGPLEFSLSQYYSYRQSQLDTMLEEYIEQEMIELTEEELKEYYPVVCKNERVKDFRAELRLAVLEDFDQVEDIKMWVEYYGVTEELVEVLKREKGISVEMKNMSVDSLKLGKEDEVLNRIVEAVMNLDEGEVTEAIEYTDGKVAVIEIAGKEYGEQKSYEEMKSLVEIQLREKKAEEYINAYISEMEIIMGEEYNNLSYNDIINQCHLDKHSSDENSIP